MTTDADNLLAQRRELMDKIEEQIDERGRIIERIQSAPDTTPIDRLRAQHRHCSCWGENCGVKRYPKEDWNSHCEKCAVTWPCDTIAALDALEARLDAATALIREAVEEDAKDHEVWGGDPDDCPWFKGFRTWLAGDKGAGNE